VKEVLPALSRVLEGEWMSARLVDTYTGDDGPQALQEFAFYRVSARCFFA
jgi:hypothetical protein